MPSEAETEEAEVVVDEARDALLEAITTEYGDAVVETHLQPGQDLDQLLFATFRVNGRDFDDVDVGRAGTVYGILQSLVVGTPASSAFVRLMSLIVLDISLQRTVRWIRAFDRPAWAGA